MALGQAGGAGEMSEGLERHLKAFRAVADSGRASYPWAHVHEGGVHARTVVFGSLVHGDEVGSVPAVVRAIEALRDGALTYGGRAVFFLGNPEAGRAGRRYLDCDLNRSFGLGGGDGHEAGRARALAPLIAGADLLVDLHQTTMPPRSPFWIHDVTEASSRWTRALAGRGRWVASRADAASDTGAPLGTTDELVNRHGGVGLTLELGQKGYHPEVEAWALEAMGRALRLMDAEARGGADLAEAAEASELEIFEVAHREVAGSSRRRLRPGIVNFQPVSAGEELSDAGSPVVRAPLDGRLLFPSYPSAEQGLQGRYLYWLLTPAESPLRLD